MSRRAAAFTQADVRRALKAAQLAQPGVAFAVEIGGGKARIVPLAASRPPDPPAPANDDSSAPAPAPAAPAPLDSAPKWIP